MLHGQCTTGGTQGLWYGGTAVFVGGVGSSQFLHEVYL